MTPYAKVKVVILGQDPYHGPGQAHGLAFSVKPGVKIPPSLANIFKEAQDNVGIPTPTSGCLIPWAEQGVLLLNATLTVRAGEPGNRLGAIHERSSPGAPGASNGPHGLHSLGQGGTRGAPLIDDNRHTILMSPHPSPMAARSGFFGSKPFSKTNEALVRMGRKPIDWRLP